MSSRTRLWAAISAVLLLFGICGYAQAVSPAHKARGVIHACVGNVSGKTFIGVPCTAGQHAVSWNKRGPVGPQGPPGSAATLNIHQSLGVTQTIPAGTSQQIQSSCLSGQAVGGGWTDAQANAKVYPTESKVVDTNTWQFTFYNSEAGSQSVTAYTICVG